VGAMTIFMELVWKLILHSWVFVPILFLLGLYALLTKPRWRPYGICCLELSANLLVIFGIIGAYIIADLDHIPYQWGDWYLIIGFLLHVLFLAFYTRREGWPTWKNAIITLFGGMLHPLLCMSLGLRFCYWFGKACL